MFGFIYASKGLAVWSAPTFNATTIDGSDEWEVGGAGRGDSDDMLEKWCILQNSAVAVKTGLILVNI